MKLKQRFFDKTVFRKDITRFAPAWGLYLIGMLAFLLTSVTDNLSRINNPLFYTLENLNAFTGSGSLINLFYAALVTQLLFGDLFNSRLCNALHALPLRRECWFVSHVAAGLLFSLVPNLIVALCLTPLLGSFWYTAFLWFLGSSLSYLLFFGISVFCMNITGSRPASLLAYGFANFCILLPMFYLSEMYVPLLYGVSMEYDKLYVFCPPVQLCTDPSYFVIVHPHNCPCWLSGSMITNHILLWGGLGNSWGYMAICAGVGVLLLVCALLLYRIRRLETAGDFVAFKPMYPIFWVLFSLGCGAICQLFMTLISSDILDSFRHLFLLLGLVCGFFGAQMLLDRNIKVFSRKRWIHLGIFLAAFAASFLLTKLDPIGITRYVPKADKVEKVSVSTNYILNPNSFGNDSFYFAASNSYATSDLTEIQQITQGHKTLVKEGKGAGHTSLFTIHYQLKDGTTLTRYYTPVSGSPGCELLWEVMNQPKGMLGFETLEEMKAAVSYIRFSDAYSVSTEGKIKGYYLETLLEAIWADAQAGNLLQDSTFHHSMHANCSRQDLREIEIFYNTADGKLKSFYLSAFTCSKNISAWVDKNLELALSFFSNRAPDSFALLLCEIHMGQRTYDLEDLKAMGDPLAFAQALYRDLDNGYVSLTTAGPVTLRFTLMNTIETVFITDQENSECYPYLLQLMGS